MLIDPVEEARTRSASTRSHTHFDSDCAASLSVVFDDASGERRSRKITYPGTSQETVLTYDGLGRCVKIVETGNTPAYNGNATKQFIWCGMRRCEERDSGGTITKQFYAQGQKNGSSAYSYSRDHLGSVREMTDTYGVIQAQYSFAPYGERTVLTEAVPADFAFTGHYLHSRTGLNLAPFRAYAPALARWLSRDPLRHSELSRGRLRMLASAENVPFAASPALDESVAALLLNKEHNIPGYAERSWYQYVGNRPVKFTDTLGLCEDPCQYCYDQYDETLRFYCPQQPETWERLKCQANAMKRLLACLIECRILEGPGPDCPCDPEDVN